MWVFFVCFNPLISKSVLLPAAVSTPTFLLSDTVDLYFRFVQARDCSNSSWSFVWVSSGNSLPGFGSGAPAVNSPQRNRERDICGWPERSVSARGHRWALPLLCAFLICHSEMFRETEGQIVMRASRQTDGKLAIKGRKGSPREGEAKYSEK